MTKPVKPMLASRQVRFSKDKRLIAQPKADGYRMLALYTKDGIQFYSRNLNVEPYNSNLQFIAEQLPKLPTGTVLDGELLRGRFEDLGIFRRGYLTDDETRQLAKDTVWMVFDIYDSKSRAGERLSRRLSRLARLVRETHNVMLAPSITLRSEDHLMKVYDKAVRIGFEGLVVKDLDSTYIPGARSDGWMKMKAMETRDGKVVECLEGKGQDRGKLGAFVVTSHGKRVHVSGFTAQEKKDYWKGRKRMIGRWLEFKVLKDSVRLPKFVRFRDEK